jgi:hypothetical protein
MEFIKQQELFNGLVANEQVNFVISKANRQYFIYLVDVPNEFDGTLESKEDTIEHEIVSSKRECIELLRLQPFVSNILIRRHFKAFVYN